MTQRYYVIVCFGSPSRGRIRSYYRSLASARRDAACVGGGTCTNIRILECDSIADAIAADIGGGPGRVVEWGQ